MTTTVATGITPRSTVVAADIPALAPSTWANVAEGLWVASRAGEFCGTVEFVGGRFEASNERGASLGRSHSLAGAKRLLDQPTAAEPENVLGWTGDRTVIALGWLAFGVSAIAAASIASQLFI